MTEAEVFPEVLSKSHGIPAAAWWKWDAPYKIAYREYVHNQAEKDAGALQQNDCEDLEGP